MFIIIKSINLRFWKSLVGPFFAFIFPLIFVGILGTLIGYYSMFAGLISLSSVAVALGCMPQTIFEYKQKTRLNQIGITTIKPWIFLLIAASYYAIIILMGTIFTFLLSLAIFSGNMSSGALIGADQSNMTTVYAMSLGQILSNTNWWGFIWSLLMCIIVSVSMGIMFMSVSKSTTMISSLTFPILIVMLFLSGQSLPLSLLCSVDGLWYASYILPIKPSVSMLIESMQGLTGYSEIDSFINNGRIDILPRGLVNIFDINTKFNILWANNTKYPIFSIAENVLNLVLPFIWTSIFALISFFKFKFNENDSMHDHESRPINEKKYCEKSDSIEYI